MTRSPTIALACATLVAAHALVAQQAAQATPTQIATLAKVQAAIAVVHDSLDAQMAQPRNKKVEIQEQLKAKLRNDVAEILKQNGMTDAEYRRETFVVSSDAKARAVFDSALVAITGVPIPGQAPVGQRGGQVAVPPGPVGVHVGHVVNSFTDTPNRMGLLPVAMAEAQTAVQHAQLAARQPGNLDYMKTHAGHVIHAIDPNVIAAGPGLGYGLKKAATGIATHLDLAAAAAGATATQIMHAGHASTSAHNTEVRAQQLLELAQKIQASNTAAEAASLVGQMVSLAGQLIPGADINGDGRVTWEKGEGGLQQVDEHIKLMLGGGR